jgi:hypothetical protein
MSTQATAQSADEVRQIFTMDGNNLTRSAWRPEAARDNIIPMRPSSGSALSPSQRNDSWEPEPLELPLVLPTTGSRAPGNRGTDHDDEHEDDEDESPSRSRVIVIDLV